DAEIEIGLVGRKGTVCGDFAQLVADAEITRRKSFAAAAKRAAQRNRAVENAIHGFSAGAHVLRRAIEVKLESAADRAHDALRVDFEAAREVTASQGSERREACHLRCDVAIEGEVVNIALEIEAEALAANIALCKLHPRIGAPC